MNERLVGARDRWRSLRDAVEARRRIAHPALAAVVIAVAAMLPLLGDWVELPDALQRATSTTVLAKVALFALFALGLNVVVGFAGLLDLGYVAFWAIGAYTAGILTGAADFTEELRDGTATVADSPEWTMWTWGLLLVVLLVAIVTGIVLGLPTLRLRGDYLAIVTLGFGEIIRITANNLDTITLGPRGITSIPRPEIHIGPVDLVWENLLDNKYYWLLLTFVVLWVIAITLLNRSRVGRAWASIREDEGAAAAMGVPVVRMKLAAFAIGACTAGVGGVVYAEQVAFINPPTFSVIQSILILSMVVIGGMGSIPGAILGAVVVVVLPEVFRDFEDYRFFAFGVAIVLLMIFRPQGLIPSRRRKAELRGHMREAGGSPALVSESRGREA
jgi:branched-chain amino acid transport system permease protein